MKKYISVLALEVRSTIYKLLLILAGMIILEVTLLWRALARMRSEYERWGKTLKELDYLPFSLEMVVEESHIQVVFLASLAAVATVLLWAGSDHGKAKSRESLWRLRVSPRTVFAIFSVYHVICFAVVIVTQILVVCGFDLFYRQVICSEKVPQVLFMAFQMNGFSARAAAFVGCTEKYLSAVTVVSLGNGNCLFWIHRAGRASEKMQHITGISDF
ncbi:MAG: hypothetical protein IJZ34_07855 [Lachnospiraceae bacterium]|nr:hypothetical protein [Lachnospiraceae bacterium]